MPCGSEIDRVNSCLVPPSLHLVNHYAFLSLGAMAQTSQNPQTHDNLCKDMDFYFHPLFSSWGALLLKALWSLSFLLRVSNAGLEKSTVDWLSSWAPLHVLELTDTCWTVSLFLESIWAAAFVPCRTVPGHGLLGWDGDGDLSTPWWVLRLLSENVPPTYREQTWNLQPSSKTKAQTVKMNARILGRAGQGWKGRIGDYGQILDF